MRAAAILAGVLGAALLAPAAAPARIAFTNGLEIAAVNADGSGRTTLARPERGGVADPDWSPDGARIALTVAGAETTSRVAVMASDGSGLRRITPAGSQNAFEAGPAWSPDGSRVAFVRVRFTRRAVINSLVSVAPDGSDPRVLRRERAKLLTLFSDPDWAPDGSAIVFTRERLGRNLHLRPSLLSVPPSGGRARLVRRDAQSLVWSPDGSRVAYVSVADRRGRTCGDDTCIRNGEIYVADASGVASGRRLTRSSANDRSPEWSPDGEWIAFSSDRNYPLGQSSEIYSMRPDGACLTWLTNGTPSSEDPSWEPGGSSDPGACGAVPRDPLVAVDLRRSREYRATPAYWLGPIAANGLLLSEADGNRSGTVITYGDCAQFDPSGCPLPFQLDSIATCGTEPSPLEGYQPEQLHEVAGVLVYRYRGEDSLVDVYVGRTTLQTSVRSLRRLAELIPQLRLLGEDTPAELPRSAFPRHVWRDLERRQSRRARATLRELEAHGAGRLAC